MTHIKRPPSVRRIFLNLSYGNWLIGCPEHWAVLNRSCYYMTGESSPEVDDAQEKCMKLLAKLPIIKSETESCFILGLMSKEKVWVWLGMKRKHGKIVWFNDAPAEPSNGALYSAWKAMSPLTMETRIVLSWTSTIKSGRTISATLLASPVLLSFAKIKARRMGHQKWMGKEG